MSKCKGGFTLIELLVVVVIIGVLVALLLPAINAARETARQTTCLNNQKELGLAMVHFEAEKQRFPGFINPNNINWAMALFPYMGRKDLWDGGWRTGAGTQVLVKQFACPNDPQAAAVTCPLNYTVNANLCKDRSAATSGSSPNDMNMSLVPAPSQTVMLGEKLSTVVAPCTTAAGPWTDRTAAKLTFTWPSPPAGKIINTVLSSGHPGVIIVNFCDMHGDKIRDDTDCADTNYFTAQ